MNPAEQREEAVFEAAVQLRAAERAGYLDRTCAGDPALRRRVEALLGALERAGSLLKEPAVPRATNTLVLSVPPAEKPGDKIGRYKLLEQIGEGGCGIVYVAEQEEPVRRRVALKVIKLGMDTKQVIARFDAERQALAMMDHPNIAKIFDAGITDAPLPASSSPLPSDGRGAGGEGPLSTLHSPLPTYYGRPYFVMELVRGIKITDYCDQNHLPPRERLDLFTQVCRAIQHAHQKGVIHRDIKPSNILVTLHDGVPVPKVIDFGIAKATQGRLTDQTVYTAFEQFIGTPAYMSPEQAEMSGLDIDTRSDIYSLGVLLYELLTGTTPFDAKELLAAGLDEMRRTIREVEPVRPSKIVERESKLRVERSRETGAPVSSTLNSQLKLLSTDLDWIVMKCLEKDRTRRYETANGLATDIARHLNNEAIAARPPNQFYRFQKSVQRNKLAFAVTGAVAAALAIGLGLSTWQFIEKSRAYRLALSAEKEAEAEKKKAQSEADKSREVAQFLEDMLNSVDPYEAQGRDTTLLREMLDKTAQRIAQSLTNQPEVEARLQNTVANVYQGIGEHAKAEVMYRDAIAIRKKLLGNDHPDIAESLHKLVEVLWDQGKAGEAETLAREALAMRRKLFGDEKPAVADSLATLSLVLAGQGRLAEAETAIREALTMQRKLLGNEHRDTAQSLGILSWVPVRRGNLAEAEKIIPGALAMQRKLLGDEDLSLPFPLHNLASALSEQGKLSEAEALFRESLEIRRRHLGNEHPSTAVAMSGLATTLRRQGKFVEAEPLYRECLAIREKKLPDAWYTFYTRVMLADALLGQNKYAEAESLLISGYEGMRQREDKIRDRSKLLSEAMNNLARLYKATGRQDKADEWKKKLELFDREEAERTAAAAAKGPTK